VALPSVATLVGMLGLALSVGQFATHERFPSLAPGIERRGIFTVSRDLDTSLTLARTAHHPRESAWTCLTISALATASVFYGNPAACHAPYSRTSAEEVPIG
jgi:hypothetical protein